MSYSDQKLREYLAIVESWIPDYPFEKIQKIFINYISPSDYEENKILLTYRAGLTNKKNISLDFVETLSTHLYQKYRTEDFKYRMWMDINSAFASNPISNELLVEFEGHYDWHGISRRSDLTKEFIEAHFDKIDLSYLSVDLGEEFAVAHWEKLDRALDRFKLNKRLTFKAVKEGRVPFKHLGEHSSYSLKHLKELMEVHASDFEYYLKYFKISGPECVEIARWSSTQGVFKEDSYALNDFIYHLLSREDLLLEERKDIKYCCDLITERGDY